MEPGSRAPVRNRRLQSLDLQPVNAPAPVSVLTDERGRPLAIGMHRRRLAVVEVQEAWKVEDGWWRANPVSRLYFRMVLEDWRQLTVYRDLLEGSWWTQRY